MFTALKHVPETILALDKSDAIVVIPDHGLCSPIIPVFTPKASELAEHLLQRGYGVSPLTYPVVKRPRIRVIIHAMNTEEQIDSFINELLVWAKRQETVYVGGSAGAGGSSVVARAKL